MARHPISHLRAIDFAQLFGTKLYHVPTLGREYLRQRRFGYQAASEESHMALLSFIKEKVATGLKQAGEHRRENWEGGWAENLEKFKQRHERLGLVPQYIRPGQPLRLRQQFIEPQDPWFELLWYEVFITYIINNYLSNARTVYEFGAGTGFNLLNASGLYPEKKYVGLDWSRASNELCDEIGRYYEVNITGHPFDFFNPDKDYNLDSGSAVLTVGALEQTGQAWQPFLQYLLSQPIGLCVHIEPIVEWYDPNDPVDQSAILYHKARGYWDGFPGKLKELEAEGRVKILKMRRAYIGSLFIEGYSQIIWAPVR